MKRKESETHLILMQVDNHNFNKVGSTFHLCQHQKLPDCKSITLQHINSIANCRWRGKVNGSALNTISIPMKIIVHWCIDFIFIPRRGRLSKNNWFSSWSLVTKKCQLKNKLLNFKPPLKSWILTRNQLNSFHFHGHFLKGHFLINYVYV